MPTRPAAPRPHARLRMLASGRRGSDHPPSPTIRRHLTPRRRVDHKPERASPRSHRCAGRRSGRDPDFFCRRGRSSTSGRPRHARRSCDDTALELRTTGADRDEPVAACGSSRTGHPNVGVRPALSGADTLPLSAESGRDGEAAPAATMQERRPCRPCPMRRARIHAAWVWFVGTNCRLCVRVPWRPGRARPRRAAGRRGCRANQ